MINWDAPPWKYNWARLVLRHHGPFSSPARPACPAPGGATTDNPRCGLAVTPAVKHEITWRISTRGRILAIRQSAPGKPPWDVAPRTPARRLRRCGCGADLRHRAKRSLLILEGEGPLRLINSWGFFFCAAPPACASQAAGICWPLAGPAQARWGFALHLFPVNARLGSLGDPPHPAGDCRKPGVGLTSRTLCAGRHCSRIMPENNRLAPPSRGNAGA